MRQIILLALILIYSISMSAQTSYYDTEKTFVEDGYTYQCIISYGKPIIYNKSNSLTDKGMTRKDGSYWGTDISNEYRMAPLIEYEVNEERKFSSVLNNAFASEYKNRIEDDKLFVRIAIDADLGKILEVSFSFSKNSGYATIPVSVYRQIELALKDGIQYVVTENGKKMNFIQRQIIYKYNDNANQNYADSIAAPKASKIFSNPDFSTNDWQELESAIEIITANCIGLNLYDALLSKYNENKILIRKKAMYLPTINYGFENLTKPRITVERMDPVVLFLGMFQANQAYNIIKEAWNKSGLNLEIEALFAQYLFVRSLPESYSEKSKWDEYFKSDLVGRSISRLSFFFNETGSFRPEAYRVDFPRFIDNQFFLYWGYSPGYPGKNLDSSWSGGYLVNLRTLTKNCE